MATQSFTIPGDTTWTVPTNVFSVRVQLWAGGGAGAGGKSSPLKQAGGGGGGGYSESTLSVFPTQVINLSVGAGGVANVGTGNDGDPGLDSWFKDTSTVLAKAGGGGTSLNGLGGSGGTISGGIGDIKFSGGNGGDSVTVVHGSGGGGGAGDANNGSSGGTGTASVAGSGGTGGLSSGGNGGSGGTAGGVINGISGSTLGGGGGGGCARIAAGTLGGSGADGKVILTWTVSIGPTFNFSNNIQTFKTISIDNVTTITPSLSDTWTHTHVNTSGNFVLVAIHGTVTPPVVRSVKLGNLSLTLLQTATTGDSLLYVYYLNNAPTGSLIFTILLASTPGFTFVSGVYSVNNVNINAPIDASVTNNNSSIDPSTDITTTINNAFIIDFVTFVQNPIGTLTINGSQVQKYNVLVSVSREVSSSLTTTTLGLKTMSWTRGNGSAGDWSMIVVSLSPGLNSSTINNISKINF